YGQSRIAIVAYVCPGPDIEDAVFHSSGVVRDEIVSERISFVGCSPKLSGFWFYRETDRIANAGRKNSKAGTVRIAYQNIGAMKFRSVSVGVINIRHRAHRDIELFPVRRKGQISSGVSAVGLMRTGIDLVH